MTFKVVRGSRGPPIVLMPSLSSACESQPRFFRCHVLPRNIELSYDGLSAHYEGRCDVLWYVVLRNSLLLEDREKNSLSTLLNVHQRASAPVEAATGVHYTFVCNSEEIQTLVRCHR